MTREHFEQLPLPPSPEAPFETQRLYWQHRAELIRDSHSPNFDVFTQGYEDLVAAGDQRMRGNRRTGPQATGYNILLSEADMPLATAGERQLIFYSTYIGWVQHVGLLLATMIQEGVCQPWQIGFGVKASKVIPDEQWTPKLADEYPGVIIQIQRGTGAAVPRPVSKTVETVVTFTTESPTNAENIALFLSRRARRRARGAIPGSFAIPDIRATANLAAYFAAHPDLRDRFALAQANILPEAGTDAQLLVLRQRTTFRDWLHRRVVLDRQLATFIASASLGVRP